MEQTKCRWCKVRLTDENHVDKEQGKKECFECEKDGHTKNFEEQMRKATIHVVNL